MTQSTLKINHIIHVPQSNNPDRLMMVDQYIHIFCCSHGYNDAQTKQAITS